MIPNGLHFAFGPDAGTARDVFERGYHRPPDGLLPMTIIDLGSNVGFTLVDFALSYPLAIIVGAELDEENYKMALKHTAPFENVTVDHVGIAPWDGGCSYEGYSTNAFAIKGHGDTPCMTLDSFIAKHFRPGVPINFMKVDIEGGERDLFKNPGEWVNRVGCMRVEVHNDYKISECALDLRDLGYATEVHIFEYEDGDNPTLIARKMR